MTKPATPVRVGDGLSFAQGGEVRAVRVLALGTRRGPAPEARLLYADLDAAAPTPDRALNPTGRLIHSRLRSVTGFADQPNDRGLDP